MQSEMAYVDSRRGAPWSKIDQCELEWFGESVYECRALLVSEETGGFSAHALRLPGVVSQGDTEEEALKNIAEAFRGAIQSYVALGKEIPWKDVDVDCRESKERWIIVDVECPGN